MYIGYSYFLHVSALEGDDGGICKQKTCIPRDCQNMFGPWTIRWVLINMFLIQISKTYRGWLRNPNHQLVDGLSDNHPIMLVPNSYPAWCRISQPSTVCLPAFQSAWWRLDRPFFVVNVLKRWLSHCRYGQCCCQVIELFNVGMVTLWWNVYRTMKDLPFSSWVNPLFRLGHVQ